MNDALLLIGHGSARYPDAGALMGRHAAAVRDSGRFSSVEAGSLNGSPTVAEALARIEAPVIRVVPFFMEEGYFSRVAVPKAVSAGIGLRDGPAAGCPSASPPVRMSNPNGIGCAPPQGRACVIGPPIGVHDAMAGVIERQALDACRCHGVPPHRAAVLIVGHGSSSAPGRALALHRHTARVAAGGCFGRVEAACLEEAPFVADVLQTLRDRPVIVVGFFANQGGHMRDDVPGLVAAEQAARGGGPGVMLHGCVAEDAAISQIILDQARPCPIR